MSPTRTSRLCPLLAIIVASAAAGEGHRAVETPAAGEAGAQRRLGATRTRPGADDPRERGRGCGEHAQDQSAQDQHESCADCSRVHRVPPLLTQDQRAMLRCRQPSRGGAPACSVGPSCPSEGTGECGDGSVRGVAGRIAELLWEGRPPRPRRFYRRSASTVKGADLFFSAVSCMKTCALR